MSDTLRGMGLSVEDEFQCPKSGYSIDMRVQDKRGDLGVGWAIEFDGPLHFLACKAPTVSTLIKRRHLELLGYILVSVPYWEGQEVSGMDARSARVSEARTASVYEVVLVYEALTC